MKNALGNLQDTDLRLLRVFQSVVRYGGFSAARDALGLTPSTISNHMTALEDRLSVKLCHRGRGGFRLTEQGKQVHGAMLDLFGSIESFRSAVGAAKGELTGTVEFGTVDAVYTNDAFPLSAAIGEFSKTAPNAVLNLHIASPQELIQGLIMGRFHVILTPSDNLPNAAESHFVFREYQQLYCAASHPLFDIDTKSITPEMIGHYPFVGRSYEKKEPISGIDFNWRSEVSYMESTVLMIMSGHYIGFLPDHYARDHVNKGRLKAVGEGGFGFYDDFRVALHSRRQNAVGKHLSELIRRVCG
ncbi:LysR family transcriptional regulator [Roseovarius pelagicus]|uniref:LysR family transcriptional regulator n=1 Tax=Roseovarius pelagicus TaxID=2980108 RepID=A0ABY6DCU5_9RHOB|nr:LysR family transcriptional regulator [Roseovarius pelagicus]UXX83890.1 LysR family transcriptional regulator [Roseovarius pelagicus]